MKTSNLALRQDTGEPDFTDVDVEMPASAQLSAEIAAEARRLARSRGLGLDYRAIEIHDDGLRPFRVR